MSNKSEGSKSEADVERDMGLFTEVMALAKSALDRGFTEIEVAENLYFASLLLTMPRDELIDAATRALQ